MTISGSPHQRRSAIIVVALLIMALPIVGLGAIKALRSTSNDPRQWLPKGFSETDTYDWFEKRFGTDEVAVVSWPGCTLDDPRVPELAAATEASPYFDRVRTGQSVLEELTESGIGLKRSAAIRRLKGILIGPDGKTTCLVLTTSAVGRSDRPAAIREIENLAKSRVGLEVLQLRLAGPTVDAAAIDAESQRLLFQLAGLSALVSFVLASSRLRSIPMAIIVLSIAGYSTLLTLAMVYFTGGKMNLLMTMLPPLIYVLSISAAVHLANYYRDSIVHDGSVSALAHAISHGWMPCTMASVTTAIGLISLMTSSIDPIREFGLYSALGVLISVVVLFTLFPAATILFLSPDPKSQNGTPDSGRESLVIRLICRHPILVTSVCMSLMLLCGSRLWNIRSTVRLQDRFLASSDVIADYRWLEQHIGPMVPLEIALHFDHQDPRTLLDRMKLVASIQSKIRALDEPTATMSAVNLAPSLPTGRRVADVVERKVINSERTHRRLVDAHFISETENEQLWRISVRAKAIGEMDYGQFAETLREAIDPILRESNVKGTYTGIIPLIYKAQRQLLQDLFRSFVAAFAVIAFVMVMVLRSLIAAILAMIPNLFPAVVVFGLMEWVAVPVQIGSVMTASAALGIAVDDTIHFLTWFRRGLDQGLSSSAALEDAFQRCSGAMMHTTLICAGGLLVFAASSFVPILHFAWLMVFLLLTALLGDLVLLPAILAGPLGRYVGPTGERVG